MNVGDILIAKDNELFIKGLSKYDKLIILDKYSTFSLYRLDSINMDVSIFSMIFTKSELEFHFWTLAEYRKLIIEDLI